MKKKKNLPGTWGADTPRVPFVTFVYFVRDTGLLQLVGDLVVCWNELDIGGQGRSLEEWDKEMCDELQLQNQHDHVTCWGWARIT